MDSRFIDVKVNGHSMWPTLKHGEIVKFKEINSDEIKIDQIILAKHPVKKKFNVIKRIFSIDEEGVFIVGDNPDPNASEDSHNYGKISVNDVIAVICGN